MEHFKKVMTEKYATFTGRAGRAEYWHFMMIYVLLSLTVTGIFSYTVNMGVEIGRYVAFAFQLPFVSPLLAVHVRRLHDINMPGWLIVAYLIPLLGQLIFIYFNTQRSMPYPNRYGFMPGDGIILEMPEEYKREMEEAEKYN